MNKLFVINGPNLNLLGEREIDIYGKQTLKEIIKSLRETFKQFNVYDFQSNSEEKIIEYIHKMPKGSMAIINLAAFTHTSIAIRDALLAKNINFIEVHITNPEKREDFRKVNYFKDIAETSIVGRGVDGYFIAASYFLKKFVDI